ncbi:MAG: EamA family transporter [Chloroflexi bacterium]|nr:EamA family transporter [Chloroflexota bacterium]
MRRSFYPVLQALMAALLFGASAPLAKLLLGEVQPIPLAALLYLGSGAGAFIMLLVQRLHMGGKSTEAHLNRSDLPWLVGAMLAGGVVAPIILLLGLKHTPASTASLLLNFESVATTIIAVYLFKEYIDRRITWSVILMTISSILLSWTNGQWGFSLGALGILGACILWGLDNNLTRHISARNPLIIVGVKGLGAGSFSLALSIVLGQSQPSIKIIILAMLLGSISYGISIQFFIMAMRHLGAARTSTLFAAAPFMGVMFSLLLLQESPQFLFWLALPIMVAGTWLMLTENHDHHHIHEPAEHTHIHSHPDEHHEHVCPTSAPLINGAHSHAHCHVLLEHSHPHMPDLHHIHEHIDTKTASGI